MLGSALYYPHIDIEDGQWLRSAVLFWNEIQTIVPKAISKPYLNSDTKLLWQEGFLEPLRCDLHPELLETLGKRVVSLMDEDLLKNEANRDGTHSDPNSMAMVHAGRVGTKIVDQFHLTHMHPEKLSAELRSLMMHSGLARVHTGKLSTELRELFREIEYASMHPDKFSPHFWNQIHSRSSFGDNDGEWLLVNNRFAEVYMSALAALLAKEIELAALTNEEQSMGVNLHTLLEDVKPTAQSDKKGALISFLMESIKIDPETKIDKLLMFRRKRETQFAELSGQFDELSSKIATCETGKELQEKARSIFVTRIRPKLEGLKEELGDSSIQSVWEGVQRAVTVSVPAGGAMAYFTGLTGTTLLAAGAALAITDIAIKFHMATKKVRRASPYTYLLDVESKFSEIRF
jgi:hypothetical protein